MSGKGIDNDVSRTETAKFPREMTVGSPFSGLSYLCDT